MYVSGHLMGGFGNQMFILAATYGYGRRYGRTPIIDITRINRNEHSNIDYLNTVFKRFEKMPGVPYISSINIPGEQAVTYSDLPKMEGNVALTGYFQHENYWKEWYSEFRALLDLPMKEKRANTCFIHVRRGDYVGHWLHQVDLTRYFPRAIQRMKESHPDIKFLVFSDDIEWCKKEEMFASFELFNEYGSEIDTLMEMASCDHAICSNSSFSWWGAYLIENQDKTIIMPDKWFNSPHWSADPKFGDNIMLSVD